MKKYLSHKVKKHSVRIAGHSTSITLEKPFWDELKNLAKKQNRPLHDLVSEIDEIRSVSLSSACRLYVLKKLTQPE